MNFQTGDTVQLRSGGPPMTVEGTRDGEIRCTWFTGGLRQAEYFDPAMLVRIVPPGQRRSAIAFNSGE